MQNATWTAQSVSKGVTTLLVTPTYSNCTAFGQAATVTTNGCTFLLQEPQFPFGEGNLNLECPVGKAIIVKANLSGCTVTFGGPQANREDIDHDNVGSGTSAFIRSEPSVSALDYTASGGICGSGASNNGLLTGNIALKGYNDAAHTTQVGVEVT